MTQEEQDAILGRTLREYNDCKKALAAVAAKLASIGEDLSSLGRELKSRPEMVNFEGVAHDARFGRQAYTPSSHPYAEKPIYYPAAIDGKGIAVQVTELQNLHIKMDDLAKRLKALGHDVSRFGD